MDSELGTRSKKRKKWVQNTSAKEKQGRNRGKKMVQRGGKRVRGADAKTSRAGVRKDFSKGSSPAFDR